MKTIKTLLLLAALALTANASDFTCSTNAFGEVRLDYYIPDCFQTNRFAAIPDYVNVIGSSAFCNRINLETIYVPDSVKEIQDGAFYGLYNLRHIRMSTNLTSLGPLAFWACSSLQCIKLPSELTYDANTFEYCSSLQPWHPWIEYLREGGELTIIYEGKLEESIDLKTWTEVPDSDGLYTVKMTNISIFFRATK